MSTRDYANAVFNSLTDNELMDFLTIFADDTTLALAESEFIGRNPDRGKRYRNFKELLAEVEEEMENERRRRILG
ncbi:MAG: hypothetical protein NC084_11315 [Bacteroides sp.]|nr:hypothetical protein [Eubacterium sp.]MCM1419453.1 hypothetical protein [Roseburia sp.]MCM1463279.1 hypothetical protein [Bacteroides sp.]